MAEAAMKAEREGTAAEPLVLDAAVIGAGVAGLYQVYLLREQGLNVKGFDAATDVGGTWYWNRYPGAKFDSQSHIYQYLFSEELYKGWSWSELFPEQPEIERWLHYVADELDLRKDFQFSTRIESATWNEDTGRWTIVAESGQVIDAQFLVSCCGMLSAPLTNVFPGQDTFKGELFHTARWPHEPVEFEGKKVGIIGNGATGIQVIQTIAPDCGHLKVFIRTPQYIVPMNNPKFGPKEVEAYKSRFQYLRGHLPNTFAGFEFEFDKGAWADLTHEQRMKVLEDMWEEGSLGFWIGTFQEMFFDEDVNEQVSEFVREKMRARLKHDPRLCELLIPSDYGFGTHRVPLESNYLEAYLLPHVEAVSVKDNPITEVVPEGLKLADGTVHELDMLILATGFDAGTGALTRIDIRGRGGRSLREDWGRDIRTTMGLQVHGYPNLFTTGAPLAPAAALCNMTTCLQQQAEWISNCIEYARKQGVSTVEPKEETQDAWVEHHDALANATLISKTNSWYMGSNIKGKPRRMLSYIGGVGDYRQRCAEVAEKGYEGFELR